MKLYSALYDYFNPLDTFFPWECKVVLRPDELTEPGILIVHGGEDIHPDLYKKGRSRRSGAWPTPSRRDLMESALMERAKEKGIFIFGICRGAQMLCAKAGGFLIQDVGGHAGRDHEVLDSDGRVFEVNSLHHQMQYPFDIPHELLAWSAPRRSKHYLDVDNDINVPCEPEAVYYPEWKGLGVQWHPEYLSPEVESNQWVRNMIQRKWKL